MAADKKTAGAKAKPKTKAKKPTAVADAELWDLVTEDVAPLPKAAKNWHLPAAEEAAADKKTPPPIPARQAKRQIVPPPPPQKPKVSQLPELGHGTIAGLDKRTAERMKKGALKIDGRLDLHGHTQDEALPALRRFITEAHAQGKRQVLVITGKGGRGPHAGVLKDRVPQWLNGPGLREHIVAFDFAIPKDGGSGALYVRLRKPRDT